jgi:AcrR family transcriptional regulator
VPNTITPIALGLRERKKLKTKEAIQREALRLIQEQGYAETTIEQIAAAAEISPSTFFNYFPTKEDVVLFDRYDPMIFSMMTSIPASEPLSAVLQGLLNGLAGVMERDHDVILTRSKLSLAVPELRARFWEEIEKARDLIASILASRTGRDASDFELRVLAMIFMTATFEAILEWIRQDGRGDLIKLVKQALDLAQIGPRLDELESASRKAKGH